MLIYIKIYWQIQHISCMHDFSIQINKNGQYIIVCLSFAMTMFRHFKWFEVSFLQKLTPILFLFR